MKKIILAVSGITTSALINAQVYAAPIDDAKAGAGAVNPGGGSSVSDTIKDVINILLFIVGALAVIMLIVGGIRYVVSGGDQTATKGAKDTILYAIIGLVVAFSAYAIVNWILNRI